MIERRRPWGSPPQGPADLTASGGDADLAAAARGGPGLRIAFTPVSSQLARAVGLAVPGGTYEVPMDALALESDDLGVAGEQERRFWDGGPGRLLATNAVVVGTAPDDLGRFVRRVPITVTVDGRPFFEGRATTVVIANGQFLHGVDVAPRGHPGDGAVEVQVYALGPGQRRAMRRRLVTGAHVPHPDIRQTTANRIGIACGSGLDLEVDGITVGTTTGLDLAVLPSWYHLRI